MTNAFRFARGQRRTHIRRLLVNKRKTKNRSKREMLTCYKFWAASQFKAIWAVRMIRTRFGPQRPMQTTEWNSWIKLFSLCLHVNSMEFILYWSLTLNVKYIWAENEAAKCPIAYSFQEMKRNKHKAEMQKKKRSRVSVRHRHYDANKSPCSTKKWLECSKIFRRIRLLVSAFYA